METVLKHQRNLLELLAVSQTEHVREWDRRAILRAFQWAEYCERLHSRFRSKPAVRSELESGLKDANQRLKETLPSFTPVMFSELAQCQHKLTVNLLRNPFTPNFIVQMLFPDPQNASQFDQSSLVTCKSAFDLLCATLDGTNLPFEAEVRGQLLRGLLNSERTRSGNEEHAKALLDAVLRDSAGKMERLYDVIAAALLSSEDESNSVTQRLILLWIEEQEGGLDELCKRLSPELCALLSRQSSGFKEVYWGVLKRWASCLEYDVMESAWVTSDGPATFNVLTERLGGLLNSGAALKQDTETALKALKLEGGDFNVKGINVWTDLIIQLKLSLKQTQS